MISAFEHEIVYINSSTKESCECHNGKVDPHLVYLTHTKKEILIIEWKRKELSKVTTTKYKVITSPM